MTGGVRLCAGREIDYDVVMTKNDWRFIVVVLARAPCSRRVLCSSHTGRFPVGEGIAGRLTTIDPLQEKESHRDA